MLRIEWISSRCREESLVQLRRSVSKKYSMRFSYRRLASVLPLQGYDMTPFCTVVIGMLSLGSIGSAYGQGFPTKPVTLIVPYVQGGTVDAMARLLAGRLTRQLGQPVTVENRPGSNGMIGNTVVARSDPDGHTLLIQSSTFLVTPLLIESLPYDVEKDFTPIASLGSAPMVLTVHRKLPVNTLSELLALAKAQPGKYAFSTAAFGSPGHLVTEALKKSSNLDIKIVPYKGTAPALAGVIVGDVSAMVDALPSSLSQIRAGKLKPLMITSAARVGHLPLVPTAAELGLRDFELTSWYGVWAPAHLPVSLRFKLQKEISSALHAEEVSKALIDQGMQVEVRTGDQFPMFLRAEREKLSRLVRASAITLE